MSFCHKFLTACPVLEGLPDGSKSSTYLESIWKLCQKAPQNCPKESENHL